MKIYSAEWWRQYRKKNGEKLRAYKRGYDSKRFKTHRYDENERRIRWQEKNPEKIRAHQIVHQAIKMEKLQKLPCERCGTLERVIAHHEDYSKPLEVNWLCEVHHKARHRECRVLKNIQSSHNVSFPDIHKH